MLRELLFPKFTHPPAKRGQHNSASLPAGCLVSQQAEDLTNGFYDNLAHPGWPTDHNALRPLLSDREGLGTWKRISNGRRRQVPWSKVPTRRYPAQSCLGFRRRWTPRRCNACAGEPDRLHRLPSHLRAARRRRLDTWRPDIGHRPVPYLVLPWRARTRVPVRWVVVAFRPST